MEDPSLHPAKRPDAIEARHDVIIDVESGRLVVYGSRTGVSEAVRELYVVRQCNN